MAVFVLDLSLRRQDVKNLLLERIRAQVKGNRCSGPTRTGPFAADGPPQALGGVTAEYLKLIILPVSLERARDLAPEIGQLEVADLGGPLESLGQSRV